MNEEAKTILDMIEKVDPEDTETLDEIDARVWCFWNELTFDGMRIKGRSFTYQPYDGHQLFDAIPSYTRSRDALKEIRPEGWTLARINSYKKNEWISEFYQNNCRGLTKPPPCSVLPTEELAELHCIIQAIEHERTHDERD